MGVYTAIMYENAREMGLAVIVSSSQEEAEGIADASFKGKKVVVRKVDESQSRVVEKVTEDTYKRYAPMGY